MQIAYIEHVVLFRHSLTLRSANVSKSRSCLHFEPGNGRVQRTPAFLGPSEKDTNTAKHTCTQKTHTIQNLMYNLSIRASNTALCLELFATLWKTLSLDWKFKFCRNIGKCRVHTMSGVNRVRYETLFGHCMCWMFMFRALTCRPAWWFRTRETLRVGEWLGLWNMLSVMVLKRRCLVSSRCLLSIWKHLYCSRLCCMSCHRYNILDENDKFVKSELSIFGLWLITLHSVYY
jgi:hypothetical protein